MCLRHGSRVLSGVLFFLLSTSLMAPAARAQAPCASEYDLASRVLRRAGLPAALSRKIETKLLNAQHKSHGVSSNSIDRALKQIDTALTLLGNNDIQATPPDLLAAVNRAGKGSEG